MEARALLLSVDPLAALAQMQEQIHTRLLEITPTDFDELKAAWGATAESR
jgi:DNA-directed RNA polymerase subunit F